MRRLLAGAAIAAAALASGAPAGAAYSCHGVESGATRAGVCAGSHCLDECWIVTFTYCEGGGAAARYCAAIDCLGSTPITGCER